VTQPRRLSAISVAARVSEERLSDGSVGYAIRGESKQNNKTKLLFCTTGVVLRRISSGDKLKGVTHIVVDEVCPSVYFCGRVCGLYLLLQVHERSVDGDLLLLELKDILTRNRKLKLVLMSATINQETFVRYFNGAPLIMIPGTTHPVEDL
jgi:ATP-dependent RNA helicase DHX57